MIEIKGFSTDLLLNHQVTISFGKSSFFVEITALPCFVLWNVELLDEPPAGEIVEVHARVSLKGKKYF